MAIQNRRGVYGDFRPEKMVSGEMAVVLSGDPASASGRSVYICFEPGHVKRITTYEDFENELRAATEELQEAFTDDIRNAISAAVTATAAANAAVEAANAATEAANAAAEAAGAYVLGDISGKTVTFTEAVERANIESEESTATIFGKIKKWFSDLKDAAFAAIANDLATTTAGSVLDARVGPVIAMGFDNIQTQLTELNGKLPTVANNLTTTDAGSVLDARQGKILNDKLSVTTNDIRIYPCDFSGDTLLNFYKSNPKLLGCFIIGTNVPTDAPANKEGYALFLRDAGSGRAIVLYIVFDSSWMYHRTIFNGSWLTNWSQI
ncbi:MAG: hypothetical protein HFI66_00860 [Lachnospiraceae bacterium]|nr:hypothetical protein [Lachnospiraceae bacterium]